MYEIVIFIALLMLSAFFSGYESAILSLRLSRIRELARKNVKNARLVARFKEQQHITLVTLLIGNNVVNICASAIATKMTFDLLSIYNLSGAYVIAIATGILTFILLVFGEITPKSLALRKAESFVLFGAKIFRFTSIILKPFRWFFASITSVILSILGVPAKEKNIYSTAELKEFVQMSHEEGAIKETERKMIHNILDFNDIDAREIMTPIGRVVAIDAEKTVKDIVSLLVKDNFSRVPVYEKHIEEIVGVIYIKDVLPYIEKGQLDVRLRQIMRKIIHVPAAKKINTLFHYFKNKKEHMAVVVNEYGNTLGVVTLEDVLEEIVGEIEDESDEEDEAIKVIDKSTIVVPGSANISEINELLHTSIEERGEYQTIAGYIFYHTGRIPKRGNVLNIKDLAITVIDSDHKKITKLKIERNAYKKELIEGAEEILK